MLFRYLQIWEIVWDGLLKLLNRNYRLKINVRGGPVSLKGLFLELLFIFFLFLELVLT